jgi:uncharacterized membrane protein YidH (DUF202 family)
MISPILKTILFITTLLLMSIAIFSIIFTMIKFFKLNKSEDKKEKRNCGIAIILQIVCLIAFTAIVLSQGWLNI